MAGMRGGREGSETKAAVTCREHLETFGAIELGDQGISPQVVLITAVPVDFQMLQFPLRPGVI